MSFKKFALLILTFVMISGLSAKPVSASAKEEVTATEVTEERTDFEVSEEVQDNTGENVVEEADDTEQTNASDKKEKNTSKKDKKKAAYSKAELRLMASIINCEAGAESYQGKLAVGIVVMNRVKSSKFPNTIKKVIYQKYQFSPVTNGMLKKKLSQYDAGKVNSKQWKSCISAAKKALSGQNTILYKNKTKKMTGVYFFSGYLSGAKFRIGGHDFK